ncbi:SDR family oxidoreductase [Massilia sp. IC2-477]|uniref:SDR family NAD(P)-dependent oxidoreductase n=1 Tax=Massilia sp. IC2-477 TaxID=2887198 RepID=UPI001D10B8CD|nr:SDR family oxidoreductase [Massilia sp. IC2-477]MCC2957210.1 SDR family oxidoreductase [Massilia sp. IC2-477]
MQQESQGGEASAALAGRVAIVTGGGTGIGRAVSRLLAAQGAAVAVVYSRSSADAEETVAQLLASGARALSLKADVADAQEVARMTDAVAQRFGQIDYLVNNAGSTRQLPFADLDAIDDAAWDALYAVNVKGAFHCARAAAPFLRRSADGAIVNIGSIAGETGYGSSLPYAVSKAALHGLTRSLARALAPAIRVNCLAPGAVGTRWWQGMEAKMHALAGNVALNRVSTPEDIAATVLMLLGARSMTGQVVRADNGQSL